MQTVAESKDGDFVLSGSKPFVVDAQAATHLIVVARTGKGADPAEGISLFLVERECEGVSVRRLPGFLAGRTFEVKLDSVKVPRSALLGDKDEGWQALQDAICRSVPVLCAHKVGGCQAVLDMTVEYSRTRVQFGQPIGRFQRVQDMILEMFDHEEAARWTTYESLWKLDTGRPAAESVHLAKAVSSQAYWEVCTRAHHVFSGVGYSIEHPLSFHTKASRHLFHYLGEPAYHRQQIAQLFVA